MMIKNFLKVSLISAVWQPYCCAQIQQLTTDYTGSVLYFSTTLNLPDSAPKPYSKIFKWDAATGLNTFLVRDLSWSLSGDRFNSKISNFYDLESPSVSSDGSLIAFVAHQQCDGCVYGFSPIPTSQVNLIKQDGTPVLNYTTGDNVTPKLDLSRNGRYLVGRAGDGGACCSVYDVGKKSVLYGNPYPILVPKGTTGTRQMVTDCSQSVFVATDSVLTLASGSRKADQISLMSAGPAMVPLINAKGTTIVYETLYAGSEPGALYSFDVQSGRRTLLFFDPSVKRVRIPMALLVQLGSLYSPPYLPVPVPAYGASIDDEGRVVLALVREEGGKPRQWLFLIKPDGSDPTWFGFTPEGYREAVISGNGKVAFAVTEWGRILRFDLVSSEATELVPRTPWVAGVQGSGWPGAANHLIGGGLSAQGFAPDGYPAPTQLGGVRVEYGGQPLPLLSVTPTEITYQLPWEFPEVRPLGLPGAPLQIFTESSSPFVMSPLERPYPAPPEVEQPGPLHQDGSPVSIYDPVRAGEVLRVYATGFDDPKGTTGQIESGPPDVIDENLRCGMRAAFKSVDYESVTVLFYGLAVEKAGVYEIRIKVPNTFTAPSGLGMLSCQNAGVTRYFQLFMPVLP
jgi:uncharacterized protein (TIGR03437 family)